MSRFNRTNEKVDWARWTWNPVTGCRHGCEYCYAHDLAERLYPEGFAPTLRRERLDAPQQTPVPTSDELRDRAVFTCSMADLLGDWVPQEWIDLVLDAVRGAPLWKFLFLTKNPRRLSTIDWPPNAWAGATVDTQARVAVTEEALREVNAPIRFVSCEPLLEPIRFAEPVAFDWLIVGGRSKTRRAPEFHPPVAWVNALVGQCAGVPVYCKPNLGCREDLRQHPEREGSQLCLL